MEKTKDQVLDKLSKLSPEQLDEMRCERLRELEQAYKQNHLHKDALLIAKRDKEKEMLEKGLKESQIERELRRDEVLFKLKRLILGENHLIKKLKLQITIITDIFWRVKG